MRSENGKLPDYMEANLQDLDLDDGRIYYCPEVRLVRNSFTKLSVSPEYYGYSYCVCSRSDLQKKKKKLWLFFYMHYICHS